MITRYVIKTRKRYMRTPLSIQPHNWSFCIIAKRPCNFTNNSCEPTLRAICGKENRCYQRQNVGEPNDCPSFLCTNWNYSLKRIKTKVVLKEMYFIISLFIEYDRLHNIWDMFENFKAYNTQICRNSELYLGFNFIAQILS